MVGTGRESQSGDGEGASHGDGGGCGVCVRMKGVPSFPYLGRLMLRSSKVLSRFAFFFIRRFRQCSLFLFVFVSMNVIGRCSVLPLSKCI